MKVLILIVIGLLVVGCGKKKLTLEEKVIGTYEFKQGDAVTFNFLENGVAETYRDGVKKVEKTYKWGIVDKEIHVQSKDDNGVFGDGVVFSINPDSSITLVALTKRENIPKEGQAEVTSKKIK